MAIPSDGSYGISEGIIYSFPVVCSDGNYEIVQELEMNELSESCLKASEAELLAERKAVEHLL
jgi:malate dehydrogenase